MSAPTSTKASAAAPAEAPDTATHAPSSASDSKYARKRFATLAAAAALRGIELRRLEGGRYLVSRLGLTRELATLDEVTGRLALGART